MIRKIVILALGLVALLAAPAAAQYGTTTTSPPGSVPPPGAVETTTTTSTAPTTETTETTTPECDVNLVDDAYTVTFNTPLVVGDPGVEANDEICPAPQTVLATTQTEHGTITGFDGGNGGFTYTPDAGYTGPDQYDYTVVEPGKKGGRTVVRGEATVFLTVVGDGLVGGNSDNEGGGNQGGSLVRTGSNTDTLVKIGGMLLVAGGAVTLVAGKRRRATS